MKKYSFLFLFMFNLFADDKCFIDSYDQILIINRQTIADDLIKYSDCSQEEIEIFNKNISSSNGKISSEILKSWFSKNVEVKPQTINVQDLNLFISSQLNLNKSLNLKNIKSLTGLKSLKYDLQDNLKIECDQCNSTGDKNFKISHIVNNQTFNSWWFTAKVLEQTKVVVAVKNIPTFVKNITSDYYKEEFVEADTSKNLLTDSSKLKYYKPLRNIQANKIIEMNDLKPINLVEYNNKVDLIIIANEVEIKTFGIAKSAGTYGDTIEIMNPRSNKKILAKIIDINKVTVNL